MIPLLMFLALDKLTFAAGYIPNIQFAPFYIAAERGYYQQAGLEIEFDYTIGPDVLKMVAKGHIQVGSVDPDAYLIATHRGMPLVHLATLYQNYPITLISKKPIVTGADLKDSAIGISGTFGASYLGLKAILKQFHLVPTDLDIRSIGYNQVSYYQQNKVDAVVGYINNEAVILKQMGLDVHNTQLKQNGHLPGVGLMSSQVVLKNHGSKVNAFLIATFRGVQDVLAEPESCFNEVMRAYLPHLETEAHLETTRAVFEATLPFLQSDWSDSNGLGQCSQESWKRLQLLMQNEGLLPVEFEWQQHVDRSFLYSRKESKNIQD